MMLLRISLTCFFLSQLINHSNHVTCISNMINKEYAKIPMKAFNYCLCVKSVHVISSRYIAIGRILAPVMNRFNMKMVTCFETILTKATLMLFLLGAM